MKLKILLLPAWFPSAAQPIKGIFVKEQAQVLARRYEVAVYYPQPLSGREFLDEIRSSGSFCRVKEEQEEDLRLFSLPLPWVGKAGFLGYNFCGQLGFRQILRAWGRPSLIHAHVVFPSGWLAAGLGRRFGLPVILTEHTSPFSLHLGRALKRHLVRDTLRSASRLIANSPALREQMSAFLPQVKIDVVGNLIRSQWFTPPGDPGADRESDATAFLCVALLSPQKGLKYLIEAAALLKQRGRRDFVIWIGGDGPLRADLEAAVERFQVGDVVKFLGLLGRLETRDWLRRCDVFILPSLHETFGIVLGEAMACGKPVIATRCGGPEYVVTPETGLLVGLADPAALADAMEKFLRREVSFRAELIRQSIEERFGEAVFLKKMTAIYEEVMSERGRG